MILHGFASRNRKNIVWRPKTIFFHENVFKNKGVNFFLNFSRSSRARAGPTLSSRARAGPIWAHISNFWLNFVCFGSKTEFLTEFLDDSAWLCMEKLKKHRVETNNLKISLKTKNKFKICPSIFQEFRKYVDKSPL